MHSKKNIALVIAICGLVGLIDSFYLVIEYFAALSSGGAPTPCSPNSLVSCTKTVQGGWAHALGVSNPLWGLLWYGMFSFYGVTRYLGSTFTKKSRYTVAVLADLGIMFSYTLYVASVIILRGVCPFCLLSTMLSTIVWLAFVLDDRTYENAIVTNVWRPVVYVFQVFALLVYCIGLIVFFGYYLPMLIDPVEAITHWSFPVIIVLVFAMAAGNWWAWLGLQKDVPHTVVPKKSWFKRLLRR